MSTTPEARPAAVVVTEILLKWSRADHIRLHAGEMTAQEMRSVKAVIGAIQREFARAGQDHGGNAAEMIGVGEVARLRQRADDLEADALRLFREKMGEFDRANAAEAVKVLRFIEAEASYCPCCDAHLEAQEVVLADHKNGCPLHALLSDHPAPEPCVEADRRGETTDGGRDG